MAQNRSTAANFILSANEPTIRQAVIPANVAWKVTNISSGIFEVSVKVSDKDSIVTPDKKSLLKLIVS